MNKAQRLNYIFGNHPRNPIQNRFGWLEGAFLGDIQTFIDGIGDLIKKKRRSTPKKPRGAGNVSLPILTNTGLELVSALFVGETKYKDSGRYNADNNVACFIQSYFPGKSKKIPRILWDSTRNGLTHVFAPKVMRRRRDYIQFTFYVHDHRIPSSVYRRGRTLVVSFNSVEYYHVLKKTISAYKIDLQNNRRLQVNFVKAWKSIERKVNNLDKDQMKKPEADFLRKLLRRTTAIKLFR